jgi:hypothetical protein
MHLTVLFLLTRKVCCSETRFQLTSCFLHSETCSCLHLLSYSDSYSDRFICWGSSLTTKLIVCNFSKQGMLFIFLMFVCNVIIGVGFWKSSLVYFLVTLKYSSLEVSGIFGLIIFSIFSSFGILRVF